MENYDIVEVTRDGDKVTRKYKLKGNLNRTDGPAVEYPEGEEWWIDGKPHRDGDLPAIDLPKLKKWYKNGKLHRENDKPAVQILGCGDTWKAPHDTCENFLITGYCDIWFLDGELHRDNAPALLYHDGSVWSWWSHGKRHRLCGPARSSGEWWINGTQYMEKQFNEKVNEKVQQDMINKLSELLTIPDTNTKKVKITVNGIDLYVDTIKISV
jgi:hypothetical protein